MDVNLKAVLFVSQVHVCSIAILLHFTCTVVQWSDSWQLKPVVLGSIPSEWWLLASSSLILTGLAYMEL